MVRHVRATTAPAAAADGISTGRVPRRLNDLDLPSGVVQTGDILIVEVTVADGTTVTISVGCRDGYTKKKKTNVAVTCG